MQRNEAHATGELAGRALREAVEVLAGTHAGIASRPFAVLGAVAAPVRAIHDGVSRAVYGAVGGSLRTLARGAGAAAAARADPSAAPLSERPVASFALGALSGAFGDHLADSPLAVRMELRPGRAEPPIDPARPRVPQPSPRLLVFLHGLCETEAAWWLPSRATRRSFPTRVESYGDRLRDELGFTPLYVRYNSGRHVSDNGRQLAEILESLVARWPVPVEQLVLVGHSMGGLVARSACHAGQRHGHHWPDPVSHVFCLGTPHLGADLEKGANVLSWGLSRLPETRAMATALNARSVGIKDLRFGSCAEDDWRDQQADEFLRDRCAEVPFLPHARYFFVGATLSPGPLGRALGDLLVRMPSASGRGNGRGRLIPFEVDCGLELTGLTHLDLLCHPAVLGQLTAWLGDETRSHSASARPSSVTGGSS